MKRWLALYSLAYNQSMLVRLVLPSVRKTKGIQVSQRGKVIHFSFFILVQL